MVLLDRGLDGEMLWLSLRPTFSSAYAVERSRESERRKGRSAVVPRRITRYASSSKENETSIKESALPRSSSVSGKCAGLCVSRSRRFKSRSSSPLSRLFSTLPGACRDPAGCHNLPYRVWRHISWHSISLQAAQSDSSEPAGECESRVFGAYQRRDCEFWWHGGVRCCSGGQLCSARPWWGPRSIVDKLS